MDRSGSSYPTTIEFKERHTGRATVSPLRVDPLHYQEQEFFRSIRDRAKKRSRNFGINPRTTDPPASTKKLTFEMQEEETKAEETAMGSVEAEIRRKIAILEVEAEKKLKAAEVAIENAKLVLAEADSNQADSKETKANSGTVSAIAQMIAIADQEIAAKDGAENGRVAGDEEREATTGENEDREVISVEGITPTIVSPPNIIRQTSVPASDANKITKYFRPEHKPKPEVIDLTMVGETVAEEEEQIVTKEAIEDIGEPTVETVAKEEIIGISDSSCPEETFEVLESKIEDCSKVLTDPNTSVEGQIEAARLLTQYAKSATSNNSSKTTTLAAEPKPATATVSVEDLQVEASISMLTTVDENENVTSESCLEETFRVLESKIEECSKRLADPVADLEEQLQAATLMMQYAKSVNALRKVMV